MLRVLQASQLMIIAAVLALAGGARASDPEPAVLAPAPCVSVVGNTLDLKIGTPMPDVWSLDAGVTINSTDGEPSLQIATEGYRGKIGISVTFESADESLSIRNERGNEIQLAPDSKLSTIATTFDIVDDGSVTITASSNANLAPKKPPATKKAVLKPVTSCPRVTE